MRLCEYFVKLKVKTPNTRKYKHTYTYIYIYIYINTRFQKRCNLKIYIKYIWVPELNYPWWNSFAHCTPWLVYKLVRLYPSSRRAGPRSLLALRHVRFSARARGNVCGKGMALLMSLDPLASPVLFVCLFFFFITASYLLYHERRNARAEVLILTAHSQAFANQSTNQRRD